MMIFIGIWLVLGILMMFFMGWVVTQPDFEQTASDEYAKLHTVVPTWLHRTMTWFFILSQIVIWPYTIYKMFKE